MGSEHSIRGAGATDRRLQQAQSTCELEWGEKPSDAVALPAERGSVLDVALSKVHVVVPERDVKIVLAYPVVRRDHELTAFLNTWMELKRRDGTIDALYGD